MLQCQQFDCIVLEEIRVLKASFSPSIFSQSASNLKGKMSEEVILEVFDAMSSGDKAKLVRQLMEKMNVDGQSVIVSWFTIPPSSAE